MSLILWETCYFLEELNKVFENQDFSEPEFLDRDDKVALVSMQFGISMHMYILRSIRANTHLEAVMRFTFISHRNESVCTACMPMLCEQKQS